MKVKRKKGYFSISAVAEMFSVHQQTIRLYEKQGLIVPKRSEGNTRLFSEEDIQQLEEIIYLTHKLGINLAGVEMIFKLKKQIKKMQREMNKVFEETHDELDRQAQNSQGVIRESAQQLLDIKKEQEVITPGEVTDPDTYTVDIENWDIEYDE